jgi:hypothetical protein
MGRSERMWVGWGFLSLLCVVACGSNATPPSSSLIPYAAECSMAVVNTDYMSTSVSLLRPDGSICADNIIHSGSERPGLTVALSGDVMLPTTPHPDGLLVLIDRYPNGAITFVDPFTAAVRSQVSVTTGFASNPHDVLILGEDKMYVTRSETNPTPTDTPTDWDEGGDVLIVHPQTGSLLGRIDLSAYTEEQDGQPMDPRPDRLVSTTGRVWTNLRHLSRDFQWAGSGRVVGIDPITDTVETVVELAGLENCTGLVAGIDGLWGVCTGVFAAGASAQMNASGLFHVDVAAESEPSVDWTFSAVDLGNRPLGFNLAAVDDHTVVVVTLGSMEGEGTPDRLVAVDRLTNHVQDLGVEAGAYTLGDVAWSASAKRLLVVHMDMLEPGLWRLQRGAEGVWAPLVTTLTNPSIGLPPIDIGFLQ